MDTMLHLLETSAMMRHIVTVEPEVLAILRDVARTPPPSHWTRWHAYSDLKRRCNDYIGWNARNRALATTQHYEAFIAFIDALLPDRDGYYSEMEEVEA